jgi:hypothetical protein
MRISLTGILKNPDNWLLREKLKKEFPIPEFKLKSELKAPPLTANHSAVGMAFDYVFCKHIMSINKNSYESKMGRVRIADFGGLADYILNYPMDIIPTNAQVQENKSKLEFRERREMFSLPRTQNSYKKETLTEEQLLEKFERYKNFLAERYSTWGENKWREKYNIFDDRTERQKIHPAERHDINDVRDIIALRYLVDNQLFTIKQKCYLHPNFGEVSKRIGAEADMIIDNTLIDIKTTTQLKISRMHFDQLICYYIFSLIAGINGKTEEKPIENIGVYFARHGILWQIPVNQLGDAQKFESFRKWLISFLRRKNVADLRGIYKEPRLVSL